MPIDPYRPPAADVSGTETGDRPGSALKAILLGLAVDVGGTAVVGTLIAIAWGVALGAGGASAAEIDRFFRESTAFLWVGLGTGLAFSALGGYVAARIANRAEYRFALMLGLFSLAFGELMLRGVGDTGYPEWARLVGNLLVLPAAFAGGHWRVLEKSRRRGAAG